MLNIKCQLGHTNTFLKKRTISLWYQTAKNSKLKLIGIFIIFQSKKQKPFWKFCPFQFALHLWYQKKPWIKENCGFIILGLVNHVPAMPLCNEQERMAYLCHHTLPEAVYFCRQDQSPLKPDSMWLWWINVSHQTHLYNSNFFSFLVNKNIGRKKTWQLFSSLTHPRFIDTYACITNICIHTSVPVLT